MSLASGPADDQPSFDWSWAFYPEGSRDDFRVYPLAANLRLGRDGSVWRELKPSRLHRYMEVSYVSNGKNVNKSIHTMILETYVGPCPDGLECCHGDGDPLNNRLDNLRWDTHRSNIEDRTQHKKHYEKTCGVRNRNAIFVDSEIVEIAERYKQNQSVTEICREYRCSITAIRMILLGQTWKHVPREIFCIPLRMKNSCPPRNRPASESPTTPDE